MENTFLVGLSRQMVLERDLEVVANNIANVNTGGYKADANLFAEYLGPVARDDRFPRPDRRVSFVVDRATWRDDSQGLLEQTGNPLDLAISGNAYFVVQTPRGERYTRNGGFQINAAGELITTEGYRVQGENGPIIFQQGDKEVFVGAQGNVTVKNGLVVQETQRGRLRLVNFAQPALLTKEGGSLYAAPAGVAPQAATTARIIQGSIEKSNVRAVSEISRMMDINRAYASLANILQAQSDLHRTAIQRLAEVPT